MNQGNTTLSAQAQSTSFNPPRWSVVRPNIPTRPRLRLRIIAGAQGWTFVISTAERIPVSADFGIYPLSYQFWTEATRQLYAMIQAREWLLRHYSGEDPERLISIVCVTLPHEPSVSGSLKGRERGHRTARRAA